MFAELVTRTPLLPGRSEIEQLDKIFRLVGTPDEASWPGWGRLPLAGKMRFATTPPGGLRARFPPRPRDGTAPLSDAGFDLLQGLLTCCPAQRTSAQQARGLAWGRGSDVGGDTDSAPPRSLPLRLVSLRR